MKPKYFGALMVSGLLLSPEASAQDTYVNEQITSVSDINGTARYVGMGGALGALGADMSVISANPAGIGLFRKADVSASISVLTQADKSSPQDYFTHFSLDQMGFVLTAKMHGSALKYLNFGANYQKKANFNHSFVADKSDTYGLSQTNQLASLTNQFGRWDGAPPKFYFPGDLATTAYDAFLLNQTDQGVFFGQGSFANQFARVTKGSLQGFDLNLSGNVKDRFYWGVTLGIDYLDYSSEAYYTEFSEGENGALYDYNAYSYRSISGCGVNAKFGFIARPIENSAFRLGFTFETPTFYSLETSGDMNIESHFDEKGNHDNSQLYRYYGPEDNYFDYSLLTPWKVRLSAGHTIGDFFAIGLEYEYLNYAFTKMGYIDYDGWGGTRRDEAMNEHTERTLKGGHNFKVGMEFKIYKGLSGRLGYNYYSTPYEETARMSQHLDSYALNFSTSTDYMNRSDANLYTVGLGYKRKGFYVDLVYKLRTQSGNFYAFDDSFVHDTDYTGPKDVRLDPVHVNLNRHQVGLTVGYKF